MVPVASRGEQESEKPAQASGRQRGEEATLTLGEFLSQNGKRIGLPTVGVLIACFVLYFLSSSMFAEKLKYPPLHPVSGTITLDGKPVADVQLTFLSQKALLSDDEIRIGTSNGQTDSEGRYTLNYAPNVRGAVAGFHRVEFSKIGPDGLETLPAKYIGDQSKVVIEVKADQADGYDIKLEL